MNCINKISDNDFYLKDIYKHIEYLKHRHNKNNNIEAKIRQQLQILRNNGFIEFMGNGHYKKRLALDF